MIKIKKSVYLQVMCTTIILKRKYLRGQKNMRISTIFYLMTLRRQDQKAQTEHIGADADFNIWDLRIHTLKSTDEGVAFLVRVKEKTFFHAGDLNWWYWEEEDDETWNEPMRQAYQKEIAKIEGEEIDYAFFPLDSRQGEESVLGINYFMQHTNTKIVFPMHMWGYDILDKFLKNSVSEPYRERIMKVKEPGQSFYFEEER